MSGQAEVVEFRSLNLQRLDRFAKQLHQRLPRQVVIGLRGTLGAGKTRLAQAIAVAAGIDRNDVTSPTFTLVHHYQGSRRIHHIDAYRLADEDEFIEIGGEELFEDEAIVLVEWPERIVGSLPHNCLMLDIDIDDEAAGSHPGNQLEQATRTIRASSDDQTVMAIIRRVAGELGKP